jgi:opacity protein-like surface antigen
MVDRSQNWIMRVFNNTNGAAVQNEWLWSKFSTSLQLGNQVEYQGYLGMRGQGSMDLGSSQTQWAILGIEYPLTNNWTVQARYGRAQTQVTNSQLSMFVTDPKISSHAWNLAVRRDNLVMALGIPVSVRSGSVEINSVTDYNYRETQEGLVAEPVVSRQKVSLKMPVQEYNLYTNYRQFLTKQSWINYNMQYRFNQGGSNTNSLLAGVNFTWTQ